jgi:hypothetical protein
MLLIQCYPTDIRSGGRYVRACCRRFDHMIERQFLQGQSRSPAPGQVQHLRMLRQMWAGVKHNKIKWNLNNLWKAFQRVPRRLMTGSRRQDLVESDDDLQCDQCYDNEFETQGSLGVDDIGERRCGLGDDRKFSVKRIDPLL